MTRKPSPHDVTTRLIHHPYLAPAGFEALPQPVCKGSTILFPDVAKMRERVRAFGQRDGYSYGLYGTPTTYALEQRLCALEGGNHCLLTPSGQAAIAVVNLGLLSAGDEVLLPANVYGPALRHARQALAQLGISYQVYDPTAPEDLESRLGPRTKLVWLEAPGSVTMEFPDLRRLMAIAQEKGVLVALDNTWGAGIAFAPFELGADVSIQALTKYPSGGADVLMGSVISRDSGVHEKLLRAWLDLGMGVGANDVEMVLRGLATLQMRYAAHDATARTLAQWMKEHPGVSQVLHPALASSPGHEHWVRHCTAAAGLFGVMFDERISQARVDAFCDALELFGIGLSWGGPMSLVMAYDMEAIRSGHLRYPGHLVRFSVGLESAQDLLDDIACAFQRTFA
jgi:cystathionine beta-lyase